MKKPNGYWTYEKCENVALLCDNKKEMRKLYGTAYNIIKKNKWDELISHLIPIGNKYKRLIYVYEFSDNCCYIGLTGNINRRNKQHMKEDEKSSVFIHIKNTKLIPNLILKTDYIKVDDAILLENNFLLEYKNNGWNILNKIKTGGIGSTDVKWNKNTCKEESKKYKNITDFMRNSSGAYERARKYGWIDEFFHRRKSTNGFWNDKNKCENESKKYKNRSEFHKNCWSAYNYSSINKWLDEFYPI